MSWVANVMLSVDSSDNGLAEELSEWLRTEAPLRERTGGRGCGFLTLTSDRWGGWKSAECDVWAGALNHADLAAVVARVGELPWRYPNQVQLLVMDQEESFFRLWMLRDGELRQYAPLVPDEEDPAFYPR